MIHMFDKINGWHSVEETALYLQNFSFFKRFTFDKLAPLVPLIRLVTKKRDELIFVEDDAIVVLNGRVILRSHKNGALDHEIIA